MCPFVGFNYRKCKKYTNNIARGNISTQGVRAQIMAKPGKPPRLEALTEGKKRGSWLLEADDDEPTLSDAGAALADLVATISNPLSGEMSKQGNLTGPGKERVNAVTDILADAAFIRTPEPAGTDDNSGKPVYDRKSTETAIHDVDRLLGD
ncbi:MAG: hypothetical protein JRC86_07555, partial [Deltaproteobacteria bacterium]|nr:hypothetical protein [Deltaproteobacteria bacterium]